MKIALFIASEHYGGAEKVFVELVNSLAHQHDVTAIIIRDNEIEPRLTAAARVYVLKSNPSRYNPFLLFELYTLLKRLSPDIIHTHAAKATELVYNVNLLLGKKHLGTKHNDRKGRIFNRMAWVTAVSEKVAGSISAMGKSRVWVIYNGLEEQLVVDRGLAELFTIVAVGRLDKIKGFAELIPQVARLPFPARLKIIGKGPELEPLRNLIRQLKAETRIELSGFRENIHQQMHDAHTVVISSDQEGGPKVLIEALYYGRMLISTPVGAVPEVLSRQFISSQESIGDKRRDVYNNYTDYSEEFARVAAEKKHLFRLTEIIRQYDDLYHYLDESG